MKKADITVMDKTDRKIMKILEILKEEQESKGLDFQIAPTVLRNKLGEHGVDVTPAEFTGSLQFFVSRGLVKIEFKFGNCGALETLLALV